MGWWLETPCPKCETLGKQIFARSRNFSEILLNLSRQKANSDIKRITANHSANSFAFPALFAAHYEDLLDTSLFPLGLCGLCKALVSDPRLSKVQERLQ